MCGLSHTDESLWQILSGVYLLKAETKAVNSSFCMGPEKRVYWWSWREKVWNRENKKSRKNTAFCGAESGTRTRDLLITNELLYQLSYFGKHLSREHLCSWLRCKFIALFLYAKGFSDFFWKNPFFPDYRLPDIAVLLLFPFPGNRMIMQNKKDKWKPEGNIAGR